MMVTFKDENLSTFRHLFLKGYKDRHVGNFALYTKADVYDHISYIIDRVLSFYITSGSHCQGRTHISLLSLYLLVSSSIFET